MTYTCCLENNVTQGCLLLCTKPDTRRALLEVNETHAHTLHRTLGQCAAFKEKIRQCDEYKKYRGMVLLWLVCVDNIVLRCIMGETYAKSYYQIEVFYFSL